MPYVEIVDLLTHNVRRLGIVPDNSARFAILGEKGPILHLTHLGCRTDIPERHFTVRSRRAFASEEIHLVGFGGVLMFLPGGKHSETAIDALRAMPAMGMKPCHIVDAGATPRVPNEIAATVRRYSLDDFCLRHPSERIVDAEIAPEHLREQATETRQGLRVRRSCRPSADDLGNRRQIQADDAILKKPDAIAFEQSRSDGPERREQKGPRPVRRLPAKAAIEIRPDGNMEHTVGAQLGS